MAEVVQLELFSKDADVPRGWDAKADWSLVPDHMRAGLRLWVNHGIRPGGFMTCVLCNDLSGSFGRADYINQHRIKDIVTFLFNHVPAACWGSPDRVKAWRGLESANEQQ